MRDFNKKLITVCSPLILAGAMLNSSPALAATFSAACDAATCPADIFDFAPVDSTVTVPAGSCPAGSTITDVNVNLDIEHTWIGDLVVTLTGPTGAVSTLLDRPGDPLIIFGCNNNNAQPPSAIDALFDDSSIIPAEGECATPNPAIAGTVSPFSPLSVFNGTNPSAGTGVWTLNISDISAVDEGQLNDWSLDLTCTDPVVTQNIPTMSIWGLLGLIGGLGLASRFFVRRRKKL